MSVAVLPRGMAKTSSGWTFSLRQALSHTVQREKIEPGGGVRAGAGVGTHGPTSQSGAVQSLALERESLVLPVPRGSPGVL